MLLNVAEIMYFVAARHITAQLHRYAVKNLNGA
jgi:hypothetical protein